MGVNKHKPHLVVYMEDNPYRDLVNGMKKLPNINDFNIDSKNPCGGWNKTLSKLEENLNLINSNENMFVLLLMDFDNKFNERYSKFENILKEQSCKARVFLLGIDVKESEDLKKTLGYKNLEEISKILSENCPKEESKEWNNKHLKCNLREIEKMKSINIFDWLFVK